ncbi:MAG: sigma-70 family RNA polymerase sigma factor [Candidatus Dormibacteraeota bacterium]|nr:sigma-70 family RNA polymerase sigma factor [Candidatus Dormibacteraeota bacterium]
MRGVSDADLAAGLAAGDQDALAELYDRFGKLAFSVALRIVGDTGRAEDVVQEVFVKVWNNADQFDLERGSLRNWLITAVRNRSIDTIRGRRAHERQERELKPDLPATEPTFDPWREVSLSLERTAVREALNSRPLEQRRAVELAYFGGYSHREIADITVVPLSTVKGRMRIGLEKLSVYFMARGSVEASHPPSSLHRAGPPARSPQRD